MTFKLTSVASLVAILVALITVGFMGAGPVTDGDLWWQMAYGRYFVENRTLIPDHSIFSWTLASNAQIYCAWIAELALYGIYQIAGLPGLFALRYAVMLLPMLLLYWVGKNNVLTLSPLVWLAFLVCYLVSATSGGLLKPELFSFMLLSILVAIYFKIKTTEKPENLCYLLPLVILVWVNTHGGFLVGYIFLGVIAVGEIANYLLRSPGALSIPTIKHLSIAALLTIAAVFCTPYGAAYPLHVARETLAISQQHISGLQAYKSIFAPEMYHLFQPLYLYISLLLTVPLFAEQVYRRKIDYSVWLLSIVFVVLYFRYGRMTYFYAVVMVFSLQYLLATSLIWRNIVTSRTRLLNISIWVAVVLMIGLSVHRFQDRVRFPTDTTSFNFGNSYLNPNSEADFIDQYLPDHKICNGYNGGGYLLWKLYPRQQVMIDPRYFPFSSWFDEWLALSNQVNAQDLLAKFDCNVWSLNFRYKNLIQTIRSSTEWQLVFVGASSAVLAKKSTLEGNWATKAADDLWQIRGPFRAIQALTLLLNNHDLKLALKLAETMKTRFRGTQFEETIDKAHAYAHGLVAYLKRDYVQAYQLLKKSQIEPVPIEHASIFITTNQFLTQQLWENGRFIEAQQVALEGVEIAPENLAGLFNVGTLLLSVPNPGIDTSKWREYLEKFISRGEKNPKIVAPNFIEVAKSALETGSLSNTKPLAPLSRPPILNPVLLY